MMARRLHPRNHSDDQEVATDVYAKVGLRARDDRRQGARDLKAYNAMVLSEWAGLAKQTTKTRARDVVRSCSKHEFRIRFQ